MNTSGRGEESQEAYRGVVLPAAQAPMPYGEHVQPAGGVPWGSAPAEQVAQPAPGVPEPADATQMLPPYPAADPGAMAPPFGQAPDPAQQSHLGHQAPPAPMPLPVSEATQMLPPYPAADPAAGPHGEHIPQQLPAAPMAPGMGTGMAPGMEQEPAEATQAMPRFEEPQQGYGQGYEQPGYDQYGQQPYQEAPQNGRPPYGADYSGYEQQAAPTNPGHDSDYDHLFRNDVPGPEPVRPRIIQPNRQQAAQPYGQPAGAPYGGPGAPGGPGGYEPGHGGDQGYGYQGADDSPRRGMSPKVLIGIVVAGCVVAGLVVGALMSGGGGGSDTKTTDAASTAPAPTASAGGGAGASAADAAKQQASALDSLLSTSGASRSSVVNAVESIKNCGDLSGAASDLTTAAGQRKDLVSKLATLPVDKLPNHAALTAALTKAWQASSSADSHYANWANQAKSNHKLCHGGHARTTGETQAGDAASGTATIQKKKAVKLWNSIAATYGLTKRQYSEL